MLIRKKDMLGALQGVLSTENGKKLLKYLKEEYVDVPVISKTVEETYYNLGKKELIEGLLRDSKVSEDDLDATQTVNQYEGADNVWEI